MSVYATCKCCGAPHDDGTANFCFSCLEKYDCSDCIYSFMDSNHNENYSYHACGNEKSRYYYKTDEEEVGGYLCEYFEKCSYC